MSKLFFYHQNQPDEKMVQLRILNYRDSNAVFAILVGADVKNAGVPFKSITTRPDQPVPMFYAAVKAADRELAEILIREGVAEPTNEMAYAGFHTLYLLSLSREALMEYDPMGTVNYECQINGRNVNAVASNRIYGNARS